MHPAPTRLDRSGYELEVDDAFLDNELDARLWIPYYLPHWSSRAASAARYEVGGGSLRLRVDPDQAPWNPDLDPGVRVSSLQTGLYAGSVGSSVGQHRFRDGLVVREAVKSVALYAPRYGLFELRARAVDDPAAMVCLWMVGFEDEPDRSGEICVCEIFGRDVTPTLARVGMGIKRLRDPKLTQEFAAERLAIDAREHHWYAAEWRRHEVAFYVDERLVKVVRQSPDYPMQLMLGIYDFTDPSSGTAPDARPKVFVVERFRGYRPTTGPEARPPAFPGRPSGQVGEAPTWPA